MATQDPDPQAVLREEILGDATRQAERLLRHARQEAESLVTKAKEEGERERLKVEARTGEAAARRRDMILASVAVESGRIRAARVEALLRAVFDAAAERLDAREGLDYRATVVRLAGEALRKMEGDEFTVEISGSDRDLLGEGLVAEMVRASGRTSLDVTLADGVGPGELVIRDRAGRQIWENGLMARLRRSWPLLRTRMAVQTGLVETIQREEEEA